MFLVKRTHVESQILLPRGYDPRYCLLTCLLLLSGRVKDKKSGRVESTDGPEDKRARAKNRNGDQDAQLSCAEAHQRGCLDPVTAMYRARCPDSKCGIHGAGCPDSNCYEQRAGCLDKKEQPHNSPEEEV